MLGGTDFSQNIICVLYAMSNRVRTRKLTSHRLPRRSPRWHYAWQPVGDKNSFQLVFSMEPASSQTAVTCQNPQDSGCASSTGYSGSASHHRPIPNSAATGPLPAYNNLRRSRFQPDVRDCAGGAKDLDGSLRMVGPRRNPAAGISLHVRSAAVWRGKPRCPNYLACN